MKPGLTTSLFVGACLLIGALSSQCLQCRLRVCRTWRKCPRMIRLDLTTAWLNFICRLDWWTRRGYCSTVVLARIVVLSGLRRNIRFCRWVRAHRHYGVCLAVQLDCGKGHSLSLQFCVCTGIPFPPVSVARLLLQDFLDCDGKGLPCAD